MSDWNLDPYRFDDSAAPPAAPAARVHAPAPAPTAPVWIPPPGPFRADLDERARRRRRRRWISLALTGLFAMILLALGALYLWAAWLAPIPPVPALESLYGFGRAPGIRFVDDRGVLLAERGPRFGERVSAKDLPPFVVQAFLAAEDRRFYKHGAVDLHGLVRALAADIAAGGVVQGGSTLTQQLAKDLFLTPDQTFKRKVQEAYMAQKLYASVGRDKVLDLYLNRVFLGSGAHGIDAGARAFFGVPAKQLTLPQAALLAALPKAPSRLTPARGMDGALARSHLVLANMRKEGWITPQQEAEALAHPPVLSPASSLSEGPFGYALDQAAAQAVQLAGEGSPDLVVRLTLDATMQRAASQALVEVLKASGKAAGANQGAVVLLDQSGGVLAMVGGEDYDVSPFNRAVQAKRQPGSSFKPFVYAAAVEAGVRPTDIRVDAPIRIGGWSPGNYEAGYSGPVTVQDALARSINTVAVQLASQVGGAKISQLATSFGIRGLPETPNLSIALGTYEVSLYDLTSAYQVFQQGGRRLAPHLIDSIVTTGGQRVYVRDPGQVYSVYDVANASTMVRMMERVITQGTARRADFGRPAAGKTGTTQNWRDAWFVGFTPDFVAGVWIGDDGGKAMNKIVGGDLPAMVWRKVMMAAEQGLPVRDFAWLVAAPAPPPPPEAQADPRNGFYSGLQADFSQTARQQAAEQGPETQTSVGATEVLPPPMPQAPSPAQVRGDDLPY
ncbi:MAG: penicillin-binding protein [Caulobacteraceae bacterium]|nr:penicillin-binding protein [Caulobacteraceae bacterium]